MFAVYVIVDVDHNGIENIRQLDLVEKYQSESDAVDKAKRLALRREAYVVNLTTGAVVW